ncbi:MAG: sulfatase-like hydrolase/transferase, partial [Planctomycetales bacterium]|nr:sulfatase-like hydrolase/transferase [Planctomycetales bacterium]
MKCFASRPFAFRLFLSLGVTLCLTLYVSTPASARPNVIYLLADDLGYGELGCYGQTQIQTPHIDQLAREGMRFTQHYAGAPVCAPSRCVLMTGKHLGHAFIRDNREHKPEGQLPIPAGEITLAECFR